MTTKLTATPAQSVAIREYSEALRTNDFNRELFAIVGLSDVGLDAAKATEMIAMDYELIDGEE